MVTEKNWKNKNQITSVRCVASILFLGHIEFVVAATVLFFFLCRNCVVWIWLQVRTNLIWKHERERENEKSKSIERTSDKTQWLQGCSRENANCFFFHCVTFVITAVVQKHNGHIKTQRIGRKKRDRTVVKSFHTEISLYFLAIRIFLWLKIKWQFFNSGKFPYRNKT